ncbi:MAG TPA: hypothetical protein VFF79_07815 [Conexibacter sp.]|jgi:hypothetical protein|nr:hypothetical protein [Conexibacter sp.]
MCTHTKLTLAALTATLLMALAVNTASANNISVSNQFFRVVWSPLNFIGEGSSVRTTCDVTLEGSFHSRTIVKTIGSLIGYVTRAIFGGCTENSSTVLTATLPWHLTYEGFSGRLPNITRLRLLLRHMAYVQSIFGGLVECLYADAGRNAEENAAGELLLTGSSANELAADPSIRVPFVRGSGLTENCPMRVGFTGTGQVTLLGSTSTRITVTLI